MSDFREQSNKDLDLGAKAYQAGDYETAIRYYEKSADAGNVIALSNLGYCYYYGRSIPVDKTKAKECWDKAAILEILQLSISWGICIETEIF